MDKSAEPFRLNDITVFPDRGRIRGPQGEQRLPARLMRLLCMLVQAEGSTISREALVAELWPRGQIVENMHSSQSPGVGYDQRPAGVIQMNKATVGTSY